MDAYLQGNTIYFTIKFYNKDNTVLIEPDEGSVKFIIYDRKYTILETKTLNDTNKQSLGNYEFGYIPTSKGSYVVEIYGTVGGFPVLERKKIDVEFVK